MARCLHSFAPSDFLHPQRADPGSGDDPGFPAGAGFDIHRANAFHRRQLSFLAQSQLHGTRQQPGAGNGPGDSRAQDQRGCERSAGEYRSRSSAGGKPDASSSVVLQYLWSGASRGGSGDASDRARRRTRRAGTGKGERELHAAARSFKSHAGCAAALEYRSEGRQFLCQEHGRSFLSGFVAG